jgi:tetratricopeptide (TPR) repeat protein
MTRKTRSLLFVPPLLASLAMLLVSCDQKPAPKTVKKSKKEDKEYLAPAEDRFGEARTAMIDGKFDEAAETFGKMAKEEKIRQPLLNWIEFHQGLALLLSGQEEAARSVFARIDDRGLYTKSDPSLAKGQFGDDAVAEAAFFVKLAHQLRSPEAIPPADANDYDKWTNEGIAYLALGLKDWDLQKYDDAVALFGLFSDVQPNRRVEWADGMPDLKKLKELVVNFANDYKEFVPARKVLDDAKTPEEQIAAVDAAKLARSHMKLTTKFSKSIDETIADMGPKATAMVAEKERALTENTTVDDKAMADAKQKRAALLAKFQFNEARQAMQAPRIKTEKARDEQSVLVQKASWLSNFKSQLIEDLNKKGYANPIKTKAGETLAGGVAKADEQQLVLRPAAKGPPVLAWTDLAPESAYDMALSFIEPDMPAEITGFRKWHLGTYAIFIGKTKEGLDLMHEAATLRPVFKDALPIFENASGPY